MPKWMYDDGCVVISTSSQSSGVPREYNDVRKGNGTGGGRMRVRVGIGERWYGQEIKILK